MLKKIFLILLILSSLSIYNTSFADESSDKAVKSKFDNAKTKYESTSKAYNESSQKKDVDNKKKEINDIRESIQETEDTEKLNTLNSNLQKAENELKPLEESLKPLEEKLNTASAEYSQATNEYKQTETYKNSPESQKDLSSRWFQVKVSELSPGNENEISKAKTTEQVINMTLWNIIQKLMIGLGSVSLLVMTFWGWYMIFFHWQDELLSKWKSMFTSWIIALIVSLSSYYMVDLLRFILYS